MRETVDTEPGQAGALTDFLERYGPGAGAEGPVLFVREVLGVKPDPWQEDVLGAFGAGERHIAVRSCHGPGKTALASWLTWLMLLTRFPQKTVATAPTSSQLQGALVPEIKAWGKELSPLLQGLFDIKASGIYLKEAPNRSFFEARTSRAESPEALQGVHSAHVLLICDEASGIPQAVYNAASGSMSGHNATTLLIGNPVRTSGLFFDAFHDAQDMWWTKKVGHMDSPRVTDEFVEYIRRHHGEDSAEFRVRCLGEFPRTDTNTLIPFEWVEAAKHRDIVEKDNVTRIWGVDVARYGDDRTAVAERTPRTARILDMWQGADLMDTTGRIKSLWDETHPPDRPETILVDDIGLGSGVLDRLRELGLPARGINVSETASLSEKFTRARSELWWGAREWFQGSNVKLPEAVHPRSGKDLRAVLASELTKPTYEYTSTGKINVQSKADMKKESKKSPDCADAFVLTFAEDLTKATFGTDRGTRWNEPIKRNLAVV